MTSDDGAGRRVGDSDLVHRLVKGGVELLALRLDRRTPNLVSVCSRPRSVTSTPSIRSQAPGRAGARFRRHRVDGAAEIVGDGEHVAGEGGDRILARIGDLALGALAEVLHLGERAQQLVLEVGDLGLRAPRHARRRAPGRRRRGCAGVRFGLGRGVVGTSF